MNGIKGYREIIKNRLNASRYQHSLCVADAAVLLSKRYGADEKKAYTAGLIHDICKNDDLDKCLQFLYANDIIVTNLEKKSPNLLHAIAGAAYARRELNIEDEDIINAIRYHTTGRQGMSLLEKIIYVADFISDDRDYADVDIVRALSKQSLEETVLYTTAYTIIGLANKKEPIHPDTVCAYNDASALLSDNTSKI